jgi:hypothetical protein
VNFFAILLQCRYRNVRGCFLIYGQKRRFVGIFTDPGQNPAPAWSATRPFGAITLFARSR